MRRALVLGASGALGSSIVSELEHRGWAVDRGGRGSGADVDVTADDWWSGVGPYDGVVWAQGRNSRGGVGDTTSDDLLAVYEANVVFVSATLRRLLDAGALIEPARGVVISSIWQITARADKIAYVASKAALGGLVPAIAADLPGRFAINGVLPGVIDTPMTRSQLSPEQVAGVEGATPGGRLASPGDVANAVAWLLDSSAAGINGQWIAVDNGWSGVRSV